MRSPRARDWFVCRLAIRAVALPSMEAVRMAVSDSLACLAYLILAYFGWADLGLAYLGLAVLKLAYTGLAVLGLAYTGLADLESASLDPAYLDRALLGLACLMGSKCLRDMDLLYALEHAACYRMAAGKRIGRGPFVVVRASERFGKV